MHIHVLIPTTPAPTIPRSLTLTVHRRQKKTTRRRKRGHVTRPHKPSHRSKTTRLPRVRDSPQPHFQTQWKLHTKPAVPHGSHHLLLTHRVRTRPKRRGTAGFQHCCGHTLPSQTTPAVACCKHHKPWLFPRSRLGRVTENNYLYTYILILTIYHYNLNLSESLRVPRRRLMMRECFIRCPSAPGPGRSSSSDLCVPSPRCTSCYSQGSLAAVRQVAVSWNPLERRFGRRWPPARGILDQKDVSFRTFRSFSVCLL